MCWSTDIRLCWLSCDQYINSSKRIFLKPQRATFGFCDIYGYLSVVMYKICGKCIKFLGYLLTSYNVTKTLRYLQTIHILLHFILNVNIIAWYLHSFYNTSHIPHMPHHVPLTLLAPCICTFKKFINFYSLIHIIKMCISIH